MGGTVPDNISAEDVSSAAIEIFKYDIVFCLYFFLSPAIFVFNLWGFQLLWEDTNCNESTMHAYAGAAIMIGYGFVAGFYYFCWFCRKCCSAQGTKAQQKAKGGSSTTSGEPVKDVTPVE